MKTKSHSQKNRENTTKEFNALPVCSSIQNLGSSADISKEQELNSFEKQLREQFAEATGKHFQDLLDKSYKQGRKDAIEEFSNRIKKNFCSAVLSFDNEPPCNKCIRYNIINDLKKELQ